MKKFILFITMFLFIFLTACTGINKVSKSSPAKNGATNSDTTISKNNSNNTTIENKKTTATVKVFFIAIDDNGKSGKKLDSGDSVVAVVRTISTPEAPLKEALSDLFSIKDRLYGQSGLYNSLYQSNLKVDSAKIVNGVATVNLSGKFMMGGELDIPRVKAQINETILQFTSIKSAKVFINGKTLDDALSLK